MKHHPSTKTIPTKTICFIIEHLDPLGQGVFKADDQIYFIPKTLPGESGDAQIVASRKGVHFAKILRLTKKSPARINSECPHYDECDGCTYLHCSHDDEFHFKKLAFERYLAPIYKGQITAHQAPFRFGHRNRIQLHYDLNKQKLGFLKKKSQDILPISSCPLSLESVQKEHQRLSTELFRASNQKLPQQGTIEIFQTASDLRLSFNQPYAAGGFEQVNEIMNQQMREVIGATIKDFFQSSPFRCLDLFGGKGNLSSQLENASTLVVDLFQGAPPTTTESQTFLSADIYSPLGRHGVYNQFQKGPQIDLLLLDPPRSGFKELREVAERLRPRLIGYISCNPTTLVRDLRDIESHYKIIHSHLFDFFPGTHHWESLLFLERKF